MSTRLLCRSRSICMIAEIDGVLSASVRNQHKTINGKIANEKVKSFSEIPTPEGLPFIGAFLDITKFRNFDSRYVYDFTRNRHKQLGPIYKETAFLARGVNTVCTSSPEDVKTLLRSEDKRPFRPPSPTVAQGRLDNNLHPGVAMVQGDEWYQIRKLYNGHLLTNKSIWPYASRHLQVANELVEFIEKHVDSNREVPGFYNVLCKWELESAISFALDSTLGATTRQEPRDIKELCRHNVYHFIARYQENVRDNLDDGNETMHVRLLRHHRTISLLNAGAFQAGNMSEDAAMLMDSSLKLLVLWAELLYSFPLWKYYPTKKRKELAALQKIQYESCKRFIQSRPNVGKGQLEKALQESDLPDRVKDIVLLDVLSAGVDTTTNAASFVLYCLATNPEKQEILREEIRLASSAKEDIGKTLQQMRYLHACNLEAQRLFPLVQGISRVTQKDLVLSGYLIPAGSVVFSTSNVTNGKNEKYFEDPHSFIPERWLKSKTDENRFAIVGSFGIGARKCPGRRFALQEIGCLLTALLSRYKIEYHHEPFEVWSSLVGRPSQKPKFKFLPL